MPSSTSLCWASGDSGSAVNSSAAFWGCAGVAVGQLPASGVQPGVPKANGVTLGPPAVALLRTYHVCVAGSTTAMPQLLPPLKFPPSGFQPAAPNWNGVTVTPPAVAVLRIYQVSVVGSTAP